MGMSAAVASPVAERAAANPGRRFWLLRLVVATLAAACAGVGSRAGPGAASTPTSNGDGVVYDVPIVGPVDPSTARLVERAIGDAEDARAAGVVVRLDTPGGLDSSMRRIIKAIQRSTIPVMCWTGPPGARAASAGTFILIGCPVAAMAPGTNVGAAHPVGVAGDTMIEKVTNDAVAYIRSLAESRGRNADWAEQAVRESVSISAQRALDLNVIDLLASSMPALLQAVDGRTVDTALGPMVVNVAEARVHEVELTTGERLIHWLSDADLGFLLFVLGMSGVIFEIFHPGLNVPGLTGLVLFILSLVVFDQLPLNVGGLALLFGAFVLFAIDLKVSAHGIPTIAGIVMFILGGLLLYQPSTSVQVSRPLLISLAVGLACVFAVAVRAALRARKAPVVSGVELLVGAEGRVVEPLAPRGQVHVGGEMWLAMVEPDVAPPLPVGATVRVLEIRGLTLVVAPTTAVSVPEPRPADLEATS